MLDIEVLEKEYDTYIKKTIKNTIINYAIKETRLRQREISIEFINENKPNLSLPFFIDEEKIGVNSIEDYITDEKLYRIIANLSEENKKILELSTIENYTSNEIAKLFNKSDSRIRHILSDIKKKIRKEYKGE